LFNYDYVIRIYKKANLFFVHQVNNMNGNSEPPLKRARVLKVPVDELVTKDVLWKSLDDFQWDKECLGK